MKSAVWPKRRSAPSYAGLKMSKRFFGWNIRGCIFSFCSQLVDDANEDQVETSGMID